MVKRKPISLSVKWCFDRVVAFCALVVLLPFLIVVAVIIRCQTEGPALFFQTRVGQDGKLFRICKFRTMFDDAQGETVSPKDDERVTPVGRWLRRTKIDCLTELINVLAGQMSFVGPRPDVPGYADKLEGSDRIVLSVKPGITGPASLKYRHEDELLAEHDDPKRYNDEVIYPDKVRINVNYLNDWSLISDLKILFKTFF